MNYYYCRTIPLGMKIMFLAKIDFAASNCNLCSVFLFAVPRIMRVNERDRFCAVEKPSEVILRKQNG